MSPSNMDLFSDDKKGNHLHQQLRIRYWSILIPSDDQGSELMTYQPSPYNNNLDLNDLLQNVDAETGKIPRFDAMYATKT